ncbi:hypothetical protein [Salaquimonas pukyongi]|uniref:hypothetical protein n=1 Tax=Salaquimonas pukyongi TaxID=2712698 RepID=UPI00096BCC54|nr:hypothetical protein [Salaquimonas pukyongi]
MNTHNHPYEYHANDPLSYANLQRPSGSSTGLLVVLALLGLAFVALLAFTGFEATQSLPGIAAGEAPPPHAEQTAQ